MTKEEKKLRKAEYNKQWYERNKEVLSNEDLESNKLKMKQYYQDNREELLIKSKERYHANKDSNKEKRKAYYKENQERLLMYQRLHKYQITQEDYDIMLVTQNNSCAVCGVSFNTLPNKQVHIDHCHATGSVRGILCGPCNLMLGHARDNPDNLELAAKYLRHHKKETLLV